jgi:hypothetical protein
MVEAMGLKDVVTFNVIICLPNFMKIHQLIQKLLGGGHRQAGVLTSLISFLNESRLKR